MCLLHTKLKEHHWRGAREVLRVRGLDVLLQKNFSGHGRDRALMSAQQLWLPEEDQDGKYSNIDRGGT